MLNTSLSSYWLILCIVIGLGYAYLLYTSKKQPWSNKWRWLLFSVRAVVVTFICALFLEPFIEENIIKTEPRELIFLWDDSQSSTLALSNDTVQFAWQELRDVSAKIGSEKSVKVVWKNLAGFDITTIDSFPQTSPITPLQDALNSLAKSNQKGKIAEVILISDGIYNRGAAPDYFTFPFKVSAVGLGDTTQKQDISITSLDYNKVVYQGNKFPIVAEINRQGFEDEQVQVLLNQNGKQIARKQLTLERNSISEKVTFLVDAKNEGYQQYEVIVESSVAEFNKVNNSKKAYINVVAGKKKILLLAAAPHPDIKAIKKAIEQNEHYEFILAIDQVHAYKEQKYDLAILFHLPNSTNVFTQEIDNIKKAGTSIWFIVGGNAMNLTQFNTLNEGITLNYWREIDEANVYYNKNFKTFDLSNEVVGLLEDLPPAYMPFATHRLNPKSETLFLKRVGKVQTQQPISIFYEQEGYKEATLLLEGFWNWRLVEYLETNEFKFFDEWVGKTVRWLTTVNTKNQLAVYPTKESYASFEEVQLTIETYNELYEAIFDQKIQLTLNGVDSTYNFSFTTERLSSGFNLGNLPEGNYTFQAEATINGKLFKNGGQFTVTENNIEQLNLQADFQLLNNLANKNNGEFFTHRQMLLLEKYLMAKNYPEILRSERETIALTQNYWLFIVILSLVFVEWFLRRYFGSY